METKTCRCCNTEVEINNRFEASGEPPNGAFVKPCDACKNNNSDVEDYPCSFCSKYPN